MGDPQRLDNAEQLEILALLEAASTEPSAIRAARALAELMPPSTTLRPECVTRSGQDRGAG